ncbi:uncharacterized protein BCR38DRAFT_469989 [Pseudomassariella vexata]|uniref:Uncharacterized protein n=1 Tax=Pseudomassariella vexata TaxID=1141098 RepID=A0A1Y2EHH9_9PEZI|nr:uncharacterized protein BCR38DRAFT_469989 [Pseudomassariella vexata]ORY70897.1 hypothetical protein BCR38DRAFT_469989 [Pseudomassariella vexata]
MDVGEGTAEPEKPIIPCWAGRPSNWNSSLFNFTETNPLETLGIDSVMVQCCIFNATYLSAFEYTDGAQNINVKTHIHDKTRALSVIDQVYGPSTFGAPQNGCSVLNLEGTNCFFDETVVQSLAYQSGMDAFNQRVIGSISENVETGTFDGTQKRFVNTRIMSSMLLYTRELSYLQDGNPDTDNSLFPKLQSVLAGTNGSIAKGMFKNLTVSLMSSAVLQPNASSPLAAPLTNVTFETYHNIYDYASDKLWLSYSLAIFLATVAVVVGLGAMVRNRAVFSDGFSTILRTTRWAHISA